MSRGMPRDVTRPSDTGAFGSSSPRSPSAAWCSPSPRSSPPPRPRPTQLSETGWVASSNTNSSSADAPQNAIGGTSGTRFSSDAYQAPGMWWQVNLGSKQTFNQVVLDSGGNTGDYADGYDVEVSNDGTNFTPVYFGTGSSQTGDRDVLPADRAVHPDPAHGVLDAPTGGR